MSDYTEQGSSILLEAAYVNADLIHKDDGPHVVIGRLWRLERACASLRQELEVEARRLGMHAVQRENAKAHADENCESCEGSGINTPLWPCGCTGFAELEREDT